jgi:hypothetical protein
MDLYLYPPIEDCRLGVNFRTVTLNHFSVDTGSMCIMSMGHWGIRSIHAHVIVIDLHWGQSSGNHSLTLVHNIQN